MFSSSSHVVFVVVILPQPEGAECQRSKGEILSCQRHKEPASRVKGLKVASFLVGYIPVICRHQVALSVKGSPEVTYTLRIPVHVCRQITSTLHKILYISMFSLYTPYIQ